MNMKIDKNVQLPRPQSKYPFNEMQIGDSILTDKNIASVACAYGNRHERKFTTRIEGNQFRTWRIK